MKFRSGLLLRAEIIWMLLLVLLVPCFPAQGNDSALDKWFGFSANFDGEYRHTQFFESDHDVGVSTWDSRLEIWLPPHRGRFSYGPYVRFAGIAATEDPAWENAFLSFPGLGFQGYPFSFSYFEEDSWIRKVFGPLRLFWEYNFTDYWGEENRWRPDHQIRTGMEYWRAVDVNSLKNPWWWEFWNGLYWQSANEFDQDYESWIFGQALRTGVRNPGSDILSWFTPYLALESSLTANKTYYWENRLLWGGGLRLTPDLYVLPDRLKCLNRLVIYAEYLNVATYYHQSAPSSIPDYDIRVGINFSIGDWWH
jgi:hypothetical protein